MVSHIATTKATLSDIARRAGLRDVTAETMAKTSPMVGNALRMSNSP